MTLEIQLPLETAFQDADKADQRLDEFQVRDRLVRVLQDLGKFTSEQRRGNWALVSALEFQPRRLSGAPVWDMHWQPMGSATDDAGKEHYFPDATLADDEIIQQWCDRANSARHPLLRARYADLAWEIATFRREALACKPKFSMAHIAIDGYLDAVDRGLVTEDLYAWGHLERAIELARSINDSPRLERAKGHLFRFHSEVAARDPHYQFWRFHEITWNQARALDLTNADRTVIIRALEEQLHLHSQIMDGKLFDPHLARSAADCLRVWREFTGEKAEADRAALEAGETFEAAAAQADGLTAITWLNDQLTRYRQLGNHEAVARIEQAIRNRAGDAQGEMKRISVPLNMTREELDAWADRVAAESLDEALRNFAAVGLVGRNSTERVVLETEKRAPLFAHIPFFITGHDGLTKATIGSIKDDLDGRTVHQAGQLLSQRGPWLNLAWERIKAKHGVELEGLLTWLSECPYFPPQRMSFIREGIAAWLAGDMVKAIHVLVPQVEAALRDVLASLRGVVTRPDFHGGSQVILLGEVLRHERFRVVPDDIRFHFQVLYQDSRGLNFRNDLAHGIAAFDLFQLGIGNLVVHSVIVIGTFARPRGSSPRAV
jgi:Domain of unknown function (DUF4209)